MKIPIKKIVIYLLTISAIILFVHTLFVYLFYKQNIEVPPFLNDRFNINNEGNIPAWFSSIMLFFVGISSLTIAFLIKSFDRNSTLPRLFWSFFGFSYIFLSLDEVAQIHEIFDELKIIKWVFVYAPFALIFMLFCFYYLIFKKQESSQVKNLLLGGLTIFLLGALVAEYIDYKIDLSLLGLHIERFIEEGFEMLGTIIVLMGSLTKLDLLLSKWTTFKNN